MPPSPPRSPAPPPPRAPRTRHQLLERRIEAAERMGQEASAVEGMEALWRRLQAEVERKESTPSLRLLDDLLNILDPGGGGAADDDDDEEGVGAGLEGEGGEGDGGPGGSGDAGEARLGGGGGARVRGGLAVCRCRCSSCCCPLTPAAPPPPAAAPRQARRAFPRAPRLWRRWCRSSGSARRWLA